MIMGLPEEEYLSSGHRACAGCGGTIAARLACKAAGKNTILVESTGCLEVVSTPYPETAWKLPWIHGAFENNSAVASGICAALKSLGRDDINVVVLGGDGGTFDIGIGAISGAFERMHNFTYICYDNEAYMNTGIQRSSATPYGASTTTSPSGKVSIGKTELKKDIIHILAAHGSPYLASASIGYPIDAFRKIKKAIETKGPTFVQIFAPCPTGWGFDVSKTIEIARLGVKTGITPLYEISRGKHKLNRPKDLDKLLPVEEYLKAQRRFKHLFLPENKETLKYIQKTVKETLAYLLKCEESGI
jgi:pyruvate ferredoxin oxidoreductase beta subunit